MIFCVVLCWMNWIFNLQLPIKNGLACTFILYKGDTQELFEIQLCSAFYLMSNECLMVVIKLKIPDAKKFRCPVPSKAEVDTCLKTDRCCSPEPVFEDTCFRGCKENCESKYRVSCHYSQTVHRRYLIWFWFEVYPNSTWLHICSTVNHGYSKHTTKEFKITAKSVSRS